MKVKSFIGNNQKAIEEQVNTFIRDAKDVRILNIKKDISAIDYSLPYASLAPRTYRTLVYFVKK